MTTAKKGRIAKYIYLLPGVNEFIFGLMIVVAINSQGMLFDIKNI